MANKRIIDRSYKFQAMADLNKANIGAGNGVEFGLPPGALLTNVALYTDTAFDGTSVTATVGDGTTTFVSAVDVKSAGAETATGFPKFYPAGGVVTVSLANTGTTTVGRAFASIEYMINGNGAAGIQE